MKLNTLRPRRLRRTAAVRSMVRETSLEINDFIYPIFVVPGANVKEEIPSMPGCYHLSVDQAVKQAEEIVSLGIPAVEIFGLPSYKDDIGSSAWDMESPVQRAMMAIKKEFPDLIIVGDVCLCQYTNSGHCGQLCGHEVDNDPTLELLAKVAVSQAEAGADIIMLDNMTPEVMKQAVELIDGRAQIECSGNITKENIQKIREIGVDFVSSGALTHSAPILDISMKNLHAV